MITTYTVQHRNMSRVYTRTTLEAAIAAGHAMVAEGYGPFDVSVNSGAIAWVWEQRGE
jgi:hypothetical protein